MASIQAGSLVREYEGEWFNEGKVTRVSDTEVVVDYKDWVQRYPVDDFYQTWILYYTCWIPTSPGTCMIDLRDMDDEA